MDEPPPENEFSEARKISNILNLWDVGFLIGAVRRHSAVKEPHIRTQLVLKDYFRSINSNLPQSALVKDIEAIQKIFPDNSREDIVALLMQFPKEDNRVRIVVQLMLNKINNSDNQILEHADDKSNSDTEVQHKVNDRNRQQIKEHLLYELDKIAEEEHNTILNNCENHEQNPGKLDTSEKELYTIFDAPELYTTGKVPGTSQMRKRFFPDDLKADAEISKRSKVTSTIVREELNTDVAASSNSSSLASEDSNGFILSLSLWNKGSNNAESSASSPEEVINQMDASNSASLDEPPQIEPARQSLAESQSTIIYSPDNVPDAVPLEPKPSTSGVSSNNPKDEKESTETKQRVMPEEHMAALLDLIEETRDRRNNKEEKKAEVNLTATSAKKFNLYKHLQEMFSAVPKKRIKEVCDIYNVNKREKPCDDRFNAIITELLSLSTSGDSDIDQPTSDEDDHYIPKTPPLLEVILRLRNEVANPSETSTSSTSPCSPVSTANSTSNVSVPPACVKKTVKGTNQNNSLLLAKIQNVAPRPDIATLEAESLEAEVQELSDEDEAVNNGLLFPLMEMFPEACPHYLRNMCKGKPATALNDLISVILETGEYPKRKKQASPAQRLDLEEQLEILKQVLPNADPDYLRMHCERLIDKPDELKLFISNAIEHHNYPSMKEYLRKQQLSAQQKQYTTEFSVQKFLETIPNPKEYFNDPKRVPAKVDYVSEHYAMCFLRNHFNKIQLKTIRDMFRKSSENFLTACKTLEAVPSSLHMKSRRAPCPMPAPIQSIPLLQEMAFYEHQTEIDEYLEIQKAEEALERKQAKQAGLLQTCNCCFDDEVLPRDIVSCENGCIFCKECVRKGAEVAFGDGKLDFLCLSNCSSHFNLQTLQAVLLPKMFSKVALKKQVEEVKAAGIEDLEVCPFCDFATIPAKDDKLFRCFNPECMKESCRLCKEPSHVPLRCQEVEKDDDVKKRTYIENKMTEALLRTCYKCGKKFIKADGCNKMTCSCGALMCYVCGQPVKDYKHFNGPGGDQMQLCPLYSDTNKLHEEAVLKGAEAAKHDMGVSGSDGLKIDPSADIKQHYEKIAKKNPTPAYIGVADVNPFHVQQEVHLMQQRALILDQVRNNLHNLQQIQAHHRHRHRAPHRHDAGHHHHRH